MNKLWANDEAKNKPQLHRNFACSVYPSMALNFGPNVWTTRHRDSKNLPFGLCAVTALGDFDSTKGGHLVLPDLRLIIEFPANSTILLPSATLVHANIPVQEGESRVSFTQFAAGDLFRYVDCGFRTETQLGKDDPREYTRVQELKKTRWAEGLKLYSMLHEILEDNEAATKEKQG
jgi:hypothetical protein